MTPEDLNFKFIPSPYFQTMNYQMHTAMRQQKRFIRTISQFPMIQQIPLKKRKVICRWQFMQALSWTLTFASGAFIMHALIGIFS